MEPGIEEMEKYNKRIKSVGWVVVILVAGFAAMTSLGNYARDQGYKQGQLDALQNKYTYLVVDGKILKVIGEEKK